MIVRAIVGVSKSRRDALMATGQLVPNSVPVEALVDTGASCTCVDPTILNALSLSPTGQTQMFTPSTGSSPTVADQYDVSIVILTSDKHAPLIHSAIPVVASELTAQGIHMLLGRDVLRGCFLTYDGLNGLFTLAY